MTDRRDGPRRPPRTALRSRSRRRWVVLAGIAGLWLLLEFVTGSLTAGTVVLLVLAAVAGLCVAGLRALGIDRYHPWVQRMAARPWRDGQDVLQLALRHLPEAFIVAPGGSLLAPNAVELHMNPGDFASLTELMDPAMIDSCACEAYQACIAEHGARLGGTGPAGVRALGDPEVPPGRYRLRQARPVNAVHSAPGRRPVSTLQPAGARPVNGQPSPAGGLAFQASDGSTHAEAVHGRALPTDLVTVTAAPPVPLLRLVTAGSAAQTRVSGARAGRGSTVELVLPEEPTISRIHARFTFGDGQWRVTGLGRNGLMVNDMPVHGEQVLRNGDAIRWGRQPDALVSRVQIGPG